MWLVQKTGEHFLKLVPTCPLVLSKRIIIEQTGVIDFQSFNTGNLAKSQRVLLMKLSLDLD